MLDNRSCVHIKNRGSARVTSIIKSKLAHLSRTEIDIICQGGFVRSGGKVLKKGSSVLGDIDVFLTKEQRHGLLHKSKGYMLDIAYEDEHILFVSKDSSMPTVANMFADTNTLSNYVAGYINTISLGGVLNAGSINRLDNETSGLVLFVKTNQAFEYLYNIYHQNDNGSVYKYYIAFVKDEHKTFPRYVFMEDIIKNATSEKMSVVNSIDMDNNKDEMKDEFIDNSKKASSEALVLGYDSNNNAILLVRLYTGLRHQIRLQLSSRGYPIIGDSLYGDSLADNEKDSEKDSSQRLMLHSYCTMIPHPITQKRIVISSDFSFMMS